MLLTLLTAAALGQCQPGQACYRPTPVYAYAAPAPWSPYFAPPTLRFAPAAPLPPPVVYSQPRPFIGPVYTLPAAPACRPGQACYRPR